MGIRDKSYGDYGFAPGEEKKLKAFCQQPVFSEDLLLLECAKQSNQAIGSDLYFSIVKGLSYEVLDKKTWQRYAKVDFYGYQRKTLALFREALIKCGRFPF